MLSIVLRDFIAYVTVKRTIGKMNLRCLTSSHDFLVLKKEVSHQQREIYIRV